MRGTYHRVLQRGSMAWWYRRSASSSLVGYWRDYIGSVRYGARARSRDVPSGHVHRAAEAAPSCARTHASPSSQRMHPSLQVECAICYEAISGRTMVFPSIERAGSVESAAMIAAKSID